MERRITATYLAKNLSDVLNRVHYRGERFVIERNGEPVATIMPAGERGHFTWRDFVTLWASLPRPDEGFADDLEAIQASQPPMDVPPWDN